MNTELRIKRPFPHIVAHKGLSGVCPENTLASFGAAVGLGVAEIEMDIWGSRDGRLIICHDPDLTRTTDAKGLITEMDWDEIRQCDAGSWLGPDWSGLRVPCLDEIFSRFAGTALMNLHIKDPGKDGWVVKRVSELAHAHGIADQAYIAGEQDVLAWGLQLAPQMERCCLEGQDDWTLVDHAIRFECKRLQFFSQFMTQEMIDRAHAHGMICNLFHDEISLGHENIVEDSKTWLKMGIDAILTNHANLMMADEELCNALR